MNHNVRKFLSMIVYAEDTGCWVWGGALDDMCRGHCTFRGKSDRAHRQSFRMFHGPIPSGLCVCHTCDNPMCVNPHHLWLGTMADNMADMKAKGRNRRGTIKHPKDTFDRVSRMREEGIMWEDIGRELSISYKYLRNYWNKHVRGR